MSPVSGQLDFPPVDGGEKSAHTWVDEAEV